MTSSVSDTVGTRTLQYLTTLESVPEEFRVPGFDGNTALDSKDRCSNMGGGGQEIYEEHNSYIVNL